MRTTTPLSSITLDKRVFVPVSNSKSGVVDNRTQFYFWQDPGANQFYADYLGGDILKGSIIGHFTQDRKAEMLYQCLTQDEALKAGQAIASFTIGTDGRMTMSLDWKWVFGGDGAGQSRYEEVMP